MGVIRIVCLALFEIFAWTALFESFCYGSRSNRFALGPARIVLLWVSFESVCFGFGSNRLVRRYLSYLLWVLFESCSSLIRVLFESCSSLVQVLFKFCSSFVRVLFEYVV